jgi:hypothetical protein
VAEEEWGDLRECRSEGVLEGWNDVAESKKASHEGLLEASI